MVKPNDINKCHNLRGVNVSSVHYDFVLDVRQSLRPFSDGGRVSNPAVQKAKKKKNQVREIENKYFTTIQKTSLEAEPFVS